MKTTLLFTALITIISSNTFARKFDIDVTANSPAISTTDLTVELGDTVDFYVLTNSSTSTFTNEVIFLLNSVSIIWYQTATAGKQLVYRLITNQIGSNSFFLSGYYYGSVHKEISGNIIVIDPVINLSSLNLIASYNLNGDALDGTGNNHNGNMFGPVTSTDRFGNTNGALSFQTGDFVDINDGVFFNGNAMSISFWFKLDQVNASGTVIQLSNDLKIGFSGNNLLYFNYGVKSYINNLGLAAGFFGGPDPSSIATLSAGMNVNPVPLNVWHNVIITCKKMLLPEQIDPSSANFSIHSGNYFEAYLNGDKVFSSYPNTPTPYNQNGILFQNNYGDYFFNKTLSPLFGTNFVGHLDDINIWGTEINSLEAMAIYNNSLGIEENESFASITIFPNPANDILNITGDNVESVEVFDMNGRMVLTETSNKVDVSALQAGVYTLLVNGEQRQRVVVE